MKAIVCTKYGSPDVLELQEVKKPVPRENEVLIRIHATTVTAGDCEIRSASFPLWMRILIRMAIGFRGPRKKILGQEFAGEVEAVGKDVKLFNKGNQVFAPSDMSFGTYAEYKCVQEEGVLALKPTNMSYDEAATIPTGGLNALHFLRKANIQSGQQVLIIGAGGSIGTYGVQLAKYYGAEVTAVDSTEKLDMLLSIGADKVIDYKKEDFTKSDQTYDVIFDIVCKNSVSGCMRSLKKNGIYLLTIISPPKWIRGKWTSMRSNKKIISGLASYTSENLIFLNELIEEGKIKSVIDRRYPLEQIADAHRYVDTGHKKGNVVITVKHDYETQEIGRI
ncbi:MAG: NAD(P)-dependent alcohol dehydrogenase [Candidatus Kariarchaeaceae archaeon]|jgi:NADPH:quinone reductase-like Zn-dependent oxidoreductase